MNINKPLIIPCIYCNNILTSNNFGKAAYIESFSCKNHENIIVNFVYNRRLSMIDYHSIYNSTDSVISKYQIFIMKDNMNIYHNFFLLTEIPIDSSLTPENYNQKLKTYLTFM